jgi:uncharacterized protein
MQRPERIGRRADWQRARFGALLLAAALLAACAGPQAVRPSAERAPSVERAERLARSGDHAGSARQWEQVAAESQGESQSNALAQAALEWLRAPSLADATRVEAALVALPAVEPRSAAGTTRALASAEVALAAGQPERALASLRPLGDPPPAGSEADVLALRGRAHLAAGRAFEGVRALTARERVLPAAQVADSQRQLWDALRTAAARGANLSAPRDADSITAGWLELARVATQGKRNPYAQRTQLAQWRSRYPQHPANGPIVGAMQVEEPQLRLPAQVALLLPLSGRLGDAGEALRDGFLAAYYQQDAASRPLVRVYDATADAALAYRRAIADGAGFVVGPLGKENAAAIKAIADEHVPTLVLNFLPDGDAVPPRFYQYALAPEDEARQVAERLLAEGRRTGVALTPAGEWGARVLAAFQSTFTAGGGTLVATRSFAASTTDFSEPLVQILGFEESQRRERALAALLGAPLQFTPRRRDDLQFVFFAGQPVQGRLVRPQLKFHYAGDLPVYSTSDVFDPNPIANQDLEGVAFVDLPWMIADDAAIAELRAAVGQLWPSNARRRSRLFAMGFDTWRLIGELATAQRPMAEPIAGMTGRLTVDDAGRVRRGLDWAIIGGDGQARPLPPPSPPL